MTAEYPVIKAKASRDVLNQLYDLALTLPGGPDDNCAFLRLRNITAPRLQDQKKELLDRLAEVRPDLVAETQTPVEESPSVVQDEQIVICQTPEPEVVSVKSVLSPERQLRIQRWKQLTLWTIRCTKDQQQIAEEEWVTPYRAYLKYLADPRSVTASEQQEALDLVRSCLYDPLTPELIFHIATLSLINENRDIRGVFVIMYTRSTPNRGTYGAKIPTRPTTKYRKLISELYKDHNAALKADDKKCQDLALAYM